MRSLGQGWHDTGQVRDRRLLVRTSDPSENEPVFIGHSLMIWHSGPYIVVCHRSSCGAC